MSRTPSFLGFFGVFSLVLLLLAASLLPPVRAQQQTTLFVSPSGADTPGSPCNTFSSPCSLPASLRAASSVLAAQPALVNLSSSPSSSPTFIVVSLEPGLYGPSHCGGSVLGPLFNETSLSDAVAAVTAQATTSPASLALNVPSISLVAREEQQTQRNLFRA